jgi:hypothetical protein
VLTHSSRNQCFTLVSDLFSHQCFEIASVAHSFGFGASGELAMKAAHGRQMQTAEHSVQITDR